MRLALSREESVAKHSSASVPGERCAQQGTEPACPCFPPPSWRRFFPCPFGVLPRPRRGRGACGKADVLSAAAVSGGPGTPAAPRRESLCCCLPALTPCAPARSAVPGPMQGCSARGAGVNRCGARGCHVVPSVRRRAVFAVLGYPCILGRVTSVGMSNSWVDGPCAVFVVNRPIRRVGRPSRRDPWPPRDRAAPKAARRRCQAWARVRPPAPRSLPSCAGRRYRLPRRRQG